MPMIYSVDPGGALSLSAGADQENTAASVKPGARNVALQAVSVCGGADNGGGTRPIGLPFLVGVVFRVIRYGTASTAASTITPQPRDPGMQAATQVALNPFSSITPGSTRTNHMVFGCSGDGPGGWVAPTWNSVLLSEGGSGESIDVVFTSSYPDTTFNLVGVSCSLETVE